MGANVATVVCPLGPRIRSYVGRKDSSRPAQDNLLPNVFAPADDLIALFERKTIRPHGLTALVGAHTVSQQRFVDTTRALDPQDSTPGVWDVKFYSETYSPPAGVGRFDSDINLSNTSTAVGKKFQGFVNNQGKWTGKFADAMYRLSVLGIPAATSKDFIECTGMLPQAVSVKRDIRRAPIMDRAV